MVQSNKYSDMQRSVYDSDAHNWSLETKDRVVGPFDAHNEWADYEHLFLDIGDLSEKICLDFGCGPARNIVKYWDRFKRIDGVDISANILEKAKIWIDYSGFDHKVINLYHCSGFDIENVPSDTYDVVMSTICLQHICVHEIRLALFKEFFRVLKPGGYFTAQMGHGWPSEKTVDYYENHYDATETNRACDVAIAKSHYLKDDLEPLGFVNFKHYITKVGPGDFHPSWIFFNVQKPH